VHLTARAAVQAWSRALLLLHFPALAFPGEQ
jgi:hypothetical protein